MAATQNYHRSEVSPQQLKVIDKLLAFPIDKAFPCMDLYRIYLLHPTSYEAYAASDAGATYIQSLLRCIGEPQNPKPLIMLTLRALSNLFKNQSSMHTAFLNRQKLVDAVTPHLQHADKNVRQAGITFLMNYSVMYTSKDDAEGRVQIATALSSCLAAETDL